VEAGERLRLFVALLLPDEAVTTLVQWQSVELAGRPALRIVPAENLHVTVAFLGGRPARELEPIAALLQETAGEASSPVFEPVGYRESRSVAMIILDDYEQRAARLCERLFEGLEALGVYEREQRKWLPHVTVARFRSRPSLSPPLPPLGRVVSSEVAVMMSRLRPSGAEYEILESVSLGG
jgi:RNA 2',3'-cyclic 3'-phosphodiesterase